MSGRSYTMKELKGIVEYIKEREAYGETKGRKMWVDFANSGSTTRTWQSLKETFLKRILPDIHNPYYRLTSDELRSFRAGSNFTKSNRKLEVHSSVLPEVPDHTDRGTKTKKANPNCNGDVGNATGEEPNIKNTDVRRDSVETVILDSNQPAYHYDSTQDIIKDLESTNDEEPVHPPSSAKSIRDVFTYSEPLTPMIQEIFHDFETDDSNTFDNNSSDHNKHSSGNVQDTCNQDNKPAPKDISGNKYDSESDKSKKIKVLRKGSKKSHKIQKPAQNMRIERTLENVKSIVDENRKLKQIAAEKINLTSSDQSDKIQPENLDGLKQVTSLTTEKSEDCHNSGFTDSSIPNNQEALNKNRCVKETETLEHSKEPDVSETIENTTVETKSNESSNYSEDKIPKKISDNKDESKGEIGKGEFKNQTKNDNSTTTEEKQVPGTENDNSQINGKQYVEPVVNIVYNNKSASDKLNSQEKTYINEEESDMIKKTCDQIVSESDKNISITRSQVDNPCLKSESLYLGGKDKPNFTQNNNRFPSENNVVLLDSHSGSDSSNSFITTPHKRTQENSKVLAKMFGFSNGAGNHKQETRIVSSTISDANDYTESMSSDSSRWTSDDEIEFVASPRKSRCSRKYLNPGSCKIVPLEHEGGLLVAYKGKVYPLIKEERSVKGRELKYMAYAPNKNAEDGASYWRKKYFQEKKKAQELSSKLMNKKRSSKLIRKSTSVESKESDQNVPQIPDHAIVNRMEQDIEKVVLRKEEQTDDNKDNKAIKIKIHSDNKEVAIEGQWQNMASILPNIMQLFDKEPQAKLDHYNSHDDDVKEKVSKIEEEIFKEIEEIDKTSPGNDRKSVSSTNSVPDVMILNTVTAPTEEDFVDNVKSVQKPEVENVTNRRKRRRSRRDLEQIRTENISRSPVKKRASRRLISESENEIIVNEEKLQLVEDIAEMNRKPIPSKHTNVPRNRALRKKLLSISSDDSTVGYKFPSPERKALEVPNNKKGPLRTPKKGKKT